MKMPWHKYTAAVLITLCQIALLTSCRHVAWVRPSPGIVSSLRSILSAPFCPVDAEQFTKANSALVLTNNRAKPASVALGKKHLSLEDCRSLALANNLDLQVARLDEFTKNALIYSNKTKMLPHFAFSGDLSDRDNPPYSYSDVLGQEGRTPEPSQGGTGVTNKRCDLATLAFDRHSPIGWWATDRYLSDLPCLDLQRSCRSQAAAG